MMIVYHLHKFETSVNCLIYSVLFIAYQYLGYYGDML